MLNSEFQMQGGLKLNNYKQLISLIKSQERGYSPKQGAVFTLQNVEDFLGLSPNTGLFTLHKAAIVIGMFGGLRGIELANVQIEDFEKSPDGSFWLNYAVSK